MLLFTTDVNILHIFYKMFIVILIYSLKRGCPLCIILITFIHNNNELLDLLWNNSIYGLLVYSYSSSVVKGFSSSLPVPKRGVKWNGEKINWLRVYGIGVKFFPYMSFRFEWECRSWYISPHNRLRCLPFCHFPNDR